MTKADYYSNNHIMGKFKEKLRAIKKVLKSDDSIIIYLDNKSDDFNYMKVGTSIVMSDLFNHLKNSTVKLWYKRWLKADSNGKEEVIG